MLFSSRIPVAHFRRGSLALGIGLSILQVLPQLGLWLAGFSFLSTFFFANFGLICYDFALHGTLISLCHVSQAPLFLLSMTPLTLVAFF